MRLSGCFQGRAMIFTLGTWRPNDDLYRRVIQFFALFKERFKTTLPQASDCSKFKVVLNILVVKFSPGHCGIWNVGACSSTTINVMDKRRVQPDAGH